MQNKPKSNVAVSADIVKSAVSETNFCEQQQAISDKANIIAHGFLDEGDDKRQLPELFVFLGCQCDVIRHSRFGRCSSTRPINLELGSISNAADLFLFRARCFKNDDYYAGVFLTKWLSDDELQRVHRKLSSF